MPSGQSSEPLVAVVMRVLPYLALGVLMFRLMKSAAGPLDNSDTWFHLRLGREFWGSWSLTDPGRPTRFATSEWVPTQWSTEMVASKFEYWFGLPGVAWLFGAIFLSFLFALYFCCRGEGSPLPATIGTGMVVIASAPSLSARPQVVSLALLVVSVGAWMRTSRDLKPRWWLVPLTWVWATAHGLWSAGLILGVACCLGLVMDRRVSVRQAASLFGVPVAALVAAALTPVGPKLLWSQFAVSSRSSMIGEWAPTSFRAVPALFAAAMIGWVVLLWTRRGRIDWTQLLLLFLACGWTMMITRMVAVGAVIAAPLLVRALEGVLPERPAVSRLTERGLIVGGIAVSLIGLAFVVPHTADKPAKVPAAMSARLAELTPGSAVLVEDGVGAWIEWRFPGLNPVIDGMFDAYPVSYMRDFSSARALEPGWEAFVRRSRAEVAVLPRKSAFTYAVERQLHWRVQQRDGHWVYLVAPTSAS